MYLALPCGGDQAESVDSLALALQQLQANKRALQYAYTIFCTRQNKSLTQVAAIVYGLSTLLGV